MDGDAALRYARADTAMPSQKSTVTSIAWKALIVLVALGTIAYLALPFL